MRAKTLALMVCLVAAPASAMAAGQDETAATQAASTQSPAPTDPASASSEVVATAAGALGAPNQPADPQLTRWLKQAPPVNLGDDYAGGVITQGAPPDRGIHGEVGVGVGTGGYRDVYGMATMPVGKSGQLGVAVEDYQTSRPFKIHARSLDVNLALGGPGAGPPADCASALRVGDHYVEPLWVTRMRGYALTDVDPRCVSAVPDLR